MEKQANKYEFKMTECDLQEPIIINDIWSMKAYMHPNEPIIFVKIIEKNRYRMYSNYCDKKYKAIIYKKSNNCIRMECTDVNRIPRTIQLKIQDLLENKFNLHKNWNIFK